MLKRKYLIEIGIMISLSIVLNVLDRLITFSFIFRIGLSNIIPFTLIISRRYLDTFIVLTGKILISHLILGTFFTHVYLVSLISNILSFIIIVIIHEIICKNQYNFLTSISVIGAVSNNIFQLLSVKYFFFAEFYIYTILLPAVVMGIVSGILISIISQKLHQKIR